MLKRTLLATAFISLLATYLPGYAAVSADEAAQLKTTLTPLGG